MLAVVDHLLSKSIYLVLSKSLQYALILREICKNV